MTARSAAKKALKKTSKKKSFSLVSREIQQKLHAAVTRLLTGIFPPTAVVEIGACAALRDLDPVFAIGEARGIGIWRGVSVAAFDASKVRVAPPSSGEVIEMTDARALLVSLVAALANDEKRMAIAVLSNAPEKRELDLLLRFAGAHRLPVLFIVSNTISKSSKSNSDLRTVYAEFGVPVITVDAHDAVAAYRAATEALHNAKAGRGATVLQAAEVRLGNAKVDSPDPLQLLEGYMRRHGALE